MNSPIRWGILGTGSIAKKFAEGLASVPDARLVAVGSRAASTAQAFGAQYQVPRCHASYEALARDPEIDAIYISTPHTLHCENTLLCLGEGKAVLCEKPFATNHAEAMVMLEACRKHKVFMLEAFMWRCHPGTAQWLKLLREGIIGDIRHIEAYFGFNVGENFAHSRLSNEQASGGIQDVGCYAMSACRLIAGAAVGAEFSDPESVVGAAEIGRTGVDEWAAATNSRG